jgi:hypothetical protein
LGAHFRGNTLSCQAPTGETSEFSWSGPDILAGDATQRRQLAMTPVTRKIAIVAALIAVPMLSDKGQYTS